jgi:hypothetical protein
MVQFDAPSDGKLRDQWRHAGIEEIATSLSIVMSRKRSASIAEAAPRSPCRASCSTDLPDRRVALARLPAHGADRRTWSRSDADQRGVVEASAQSSDQAEARTYLNAPSTREPQRAVRTPKRPSKRQRDLPNHP